MKKFTYPAKNFLLEKAYVAFSILLTYHTISLTFLMRRAQTLPKTVEFVKSIITNFNEFFSIFGFHAYLLLFFLFIYELLQYSKNNQTFILKKGFYYQLSFYAILFFLFIEAGGVLNNGFVYFQY